MGQDGSHIIEGWEPTETLSSRSIEAVAEHIRSGAVRRIVLMTGAGISTSAGIPDFRSPDTGLYANLARLNLPYAEAIFDTSYFRQNPEPFYTLAQELYPGRYRPTIAHSFIRLLHDKQLLLKCFTQNIDTLERAAGVPDTKIIEAHGSFAGQHCIECRESFPDDLMNEAIRTKTVPYCTKTSCKGLVKPDIVFFGEQLPMKFLMNRELPAQADLVIVMGTSLTVHPFAALPQLAQEGVPRVLINNERVGDLGTRLDDVLILNNCDEGVRELADACGWLSELEALWAQTAPTPPAGPAGAEQIDGHEVRGKSKDETAQIEVDKLTREVEETLDRAEKHRNLVEGYMARNEGQRPKTETPQEPVDMYDLSKQVEASLTIGNTRQEYLDRQMEAKTGALFTDLLEHAARLREQHNQQKEQQQKKEPRSDDSGGSNEGLEHVSPFNTDKPSL